MESWIADNLARWLGPPREWEYLVTVRIAIEDPMVPEYPTMLRAEKDVMITSPDRIVDYDGDEFANLIWDELFIAYPDLTAIADDLRDLMIVKVTEIS